MTSPPPWTAERTGRVPGALPSVRLTNLAVDLVLSIVVSVFGLGQYKKSWLQAFSTHPALEERIAVLEAGRYQ